MILNGHILATPLIGLTTALVGLTRHTNDIEWIQYYHDCFSWTHKTHD